MSKLLKVLRFEIYALSFFMWMTPHTLAGVAIVSQIENPAISLPLAFASHYVLDFIPHWTQSPSFKGKEGMALYIDFLIGLSIGLFFAFQHPFGSGQFWMVITGAALANLPDALHIPLLLKEGSLQKIKEKKNFHTLIDQDLGPKNGTIFKCLKGKVWVGILTQVLMVSLCLWFLLH